MVTLSTMCWPICLFWVSDCNFYPIQFLIPSAWSIHIIEKIQRDKLNGAEIGFPVRILYCQSIYTADLVSPQWDLDSHCGYCIAATFLLRILYYCAQCFYCRCCFTAPGFSFPLQTLYYCGIYTPDLVLPLWDLHFQSRYVQTCTLYNPDHRVSVIFYSNSNLSSICIHFRTHHSNTVVW